jgi:hypothetical protein
MLAKGVTKFGPVPAMGGAKIAAIRTRDRSISVAIHYGTQVLGSLISSYLKVN